MIAVHLPGSADADRLVDALLVASGAIPAPADPAERQIYLDLAHGLGKGLDAIARPTQTPKDSR